MASLRQLECLVRVADEGSFTLAAELMGFTQPALSHQIRALEQEAGGSLIERLPRSVRLTAAGRAMLPHARAALLSADRALAGARASNGLTQGELHVSTVYSIGLGVLPPVLRTWRREHPDILVRLFEHSHADQMRTAVLAGEADLAIGPIPTDWSGAVHPLGEEEYVLVFGADEDLPAGDDPVDLRDLAGSTWVHYCTDNSLAVLLDEVCAEAGFTPKVAVRTEQTAAAPLLAAAGLGLTLAPAHIIPRSFAGRVRRTRPPICRAVAAYTRGRVAPVAEAFIRHLLAAPHLLAGDRG